MGRTVPTSGRGVLQASDISVTLRRHPSVETPAARNKKKPCKTRGGYGGSKRIARDRPGEKPLWGISGRMQLLRLHERDAMHNDEP
jgi:hypothetical protein